MPRRHPDWIKVKPPGSPNYLRLKRILREKNLVREPGLDQQLDALRAPFKRRLEIRHEPAMNVVHA